MHALVADIAAYPQFLPGCIAAVVEHTEGSLVRARLGFRVKGLSDSFATENIHEDDAIEMRLIDGPFRALTGRWTFQMITEQACKVSLDLNVDFGNRLLESTLTPWVDRAVGEVIDAFRRRAGTLYGNAAASGL